MQSKTFRRLLLATTLLGWGLGPALGQWDQPPVQYGSGPGGAGGGGGGGSSTPGGSTTQLQYNNAGAFGGLSTLTTDGTNLTLTGGAFGVNGPKTGASWGTSGFLFKQVGNQVIDSSNAGTRATTYTNLFGGNIVRNLNAGSIFTNYYGSYFLADTALNGNTTFTNNWALGADSLKVNGTANVTLVTTALGSNGGLGIGTTYGIFQEGTQLTFFGNNLRRAAIDASNGFVINGSLGIGFAAGTVGSNPAVADTGMFRDSVLGAGNFSFGNGTANDKTGTLNAGKISLGGATQSTFALAITGTANISSTLQLGASGPVLNPNFGGSGRLDIQDGSGNHSLYIGEQGNGGTTGKYFGFSTNPGNTGADLFLTRAAAASLQSGAPDVDTGPVPQIFRSQGALAGGTSNVAGADWTFLASTSKGNVNGGRFIFQQTYAGSSGTVVNSPVTILTSPTSSGGNWIIGNGSGLTVPGTILGSGAVQAGSSGQFYFASRSSIDSPSDGIVRLTNFAQTDFTRLQFGGTTSSFPSIKRSSAAIAFRLADDSADAAITSAGITTSGQIVAANMTQTSAAQSGTVCFAAAGLTYDATLGCLASLPELKNIEPGGIRGALSEAMHMHPIWFSWKRTTPEWRGGDHAIQAGLNAREVEKIDKRLVAYGPDGKLRGVRYAELTAFLLAALQEEHTANDNLARRISALEKRR